MAYYNQIHRSWYRAVVDYKCNFFDKQKEHYIIWLIDRGYPIQAKAVSLRKLHEQFCDIKLSEPILKVGVSHVLPFAEQYDYMNECSYKERADNWDAFTVKKFKEVLESADCIRFTPEYFVDDHYFGKVFIQGQEERFERALDILVNIGNAEETSINTDVFLVELGKGQTLNIERYQDNDRRNIRASHYSTQNYLNNHIKERNPQYAQNVEVVECFDDTPINNLPKNIPVEMHPLNKVTRWLDNYVETPLADPEPIQDETEVIPCLTVMKSFSSNNGCQSPVAVQKMHSYTVSRSPKVRPSEVELKEAVYLSKRDTSKEVSAANNLLQKIREKQLQRQKSEGMSVDVKRFPDMSSLGYVSDSYQMHIKEKQVIPKEVKGKPVAAKRVIDLIPAGYDTIVSQIQRQTKVVKKIPAMKKGKGGVLRSWKERRNTKSVSLILFL